MIARRSIVPKRLAALIVCSLIATTVPFSGATAEYGIPAGSGAVITAGQPLLVRATPGWDAAVSYEIADGSSVTVWDVEQVAPDGSLWYPVDGGFVPVNAVTSVATLDGGVALYQEAAPEAGAEAGVEPVAQGWVDPATGQWVVPAPAAEVVAPVAADMVAEPAPADIWAEPAPATTGGAESWGEPIAMAYISGSNGDGAVCRAGADRGAERLAVLGEGEAVEVLGEAVGEWQPVNCEGVGGYVNSSLIAWEPAFVELEQRRRDRDRDRDNNGHSGNNGNRGGGAGHDGTATASGQQIASFAQQYVGYPYIYAGEGPYAFDCSGLTKFVIQNTLGMDITHDLFAQYDMGRQVGRDELQPGDLVFFQNTFRPGLSHNGIYIGGGQFVHAENESTGVKVSELSSEYYSTRWYGAVRFT